MFSIGVIHKPYLTSTPVIVKSCMIWNKNYYEELRKYVSSFVLSVWWSCQKPLGGDA